MSKVNVRDRNKNYPDKKPNWEYRFEAARVDGKRKSISKAGFRTKKEALDAGAKALAEYNNAGLHFEPSEISVSDYLDIFFEQNCKVNLKYNTQLAYRSVIDLHLKPNFGSYKLKSLTPTLIQDYANKVGMSGFSRSHTTGILSTLNVALAYAVHPLGLIQNNPMQHVKFPKNGERRRERTVIQPDEFESIIKRFPFGDRYHIPLMLGWHCGLRISEAFALTWDDIDFENKTLTVNKQMIKRNFAENPRAVLRIKGKKEEKCGWYFGAPKYNSKRTIKIDNVLLEELKKEKARQENNEKIYGDFYTIQVLKKETDEKGEEIYRLLSLSKGIDTTAQRVYMVAISENGTYTSTDSFKYPSRVIRNQMLLKFDYHSLRHTHATILIENGVSPKAVQQRLGHRSIVTTLQTYVHSTDKIMNDAVNVFENFILSGCTKDRCSERK